MTVPTTITGTETTDAAARTAAEPAPRGRHPSATRRLIVAELRLLARDPLTLTFVVVFPIVTMLIIGGSFGTDPDDVFPVNPAHWYVASYFTVVIGATGLIMLPVHIASYRERGVLRRFAASGFPRWSFALAEFVLGIAAIVVAGPLMLAVAATAYGVPEAEQPLRVLVAVVVAATAFIGIGVVLGTLLPSARAAQAVGLMLFFPSFLLGGGGPPPEVMSDSLRSVAGKMPLALANESIREPWLGVSSATGALLATSAIAIVVAAIAARRTAL